MHEEPWRATRMTRTWPIASTALVAHRGTAVSFLVADPLCFDGCLLLPLPPGEGWGEGVPSLWEKPLTLPSPRGRGYCNARLSKALPLSWRICPSMV